jgi:hypothetical protein
MDLPLLKKRYHTYFMDIIFAFSLQKYAIGTRYMFVGDSTALKPDYINVIFCHANTASSTPLPSQSLIRMLIFCG